MEIKQTIFDYLAVAAGERIHSQMIKWLLSENALTKIQKSNLLTRLFKIDSSIVFDKISVKTEYKRIDIFIEADEYIFAIENKLKSSERLNQTKEYQEAILQIRLEEKYSVENCKFGYLTLIDEDAISNGYINLSYSRLLECLQNITAGVQEIHFHLLEYISTLENLDKVFTAFNTDHSQFTYVFTNGQIAIANKKTIYTNKYEEYISTNQLETIFQKAFFLRIKHKLTSLQKGTPNDSFIFETRGNAGLVVTVYRNLEVGYCLSFQLQANSLKIDLQELRDGRIVDYLESRYSNISKFEEAFIAKYKIDGRRFNKPKKTKNRKEPLGRFSVSRKLAKPIYELGIDQIVEIILKEIDLILEQENNPTASQT
jgi:PD-(D/E)XK nuclease superfamily